jgi:hypothetical protein
LSFQACLAAHAGQRAGFEVAARFAGHGHGTGPIGMAVLAVAARLVVEPPPLGFDPQRQDDDGYNWTRLRFARAVADVLPGSSVVIGSAIGRYRAKVIAWDFEVSDDDPIVTLELLA